MHNTGFNLRESDLVAWVGIQYGELVNDASLEFGTELAWAQHIFQKIPLYVWSKASFENQFKNSP